jgi:formylglycine-generating enzyme required for sulfatase activity
MKMRVLSSLALAILVLLVMGCPILETTDPNPIASMIVFADGATVTRQLGSGAYTNTVSVVGDGAITYSSGTPATATVNAGTGQVTLVALGTTVITASMAATATHSAVSASYTLTVTDKTPSTIVFADGPAVTKVLGSGSYTNTVSGVGDGAITYTSGTPATATVNANTGEVTLLAVGTTVITANKAATATHAAVSASYTLTVQLLTLVTVPAGSFQRDATATNISTITTAYRMSAHEITRAQFVEIMVTDPSDGGSSSGTTDPVQMTNWYHVIAFCNKLSLAEGLTPVYTVTGVDFTTLTYGAIPTTGNADWNAATATWTNNGYRLPTEMEWMWAAMGAPGDGQGGGTNTTGYAKAFAGSTGSNVIGDYAVFGYYGGETGRTTTERTNPVGSKLANELGLYDMSGNVWEWCWDWYAGYPTGTQTDYRGAASGANRVKRVGCWNSPASDCTVAHRVGLNPEGRTDAIGFRVVRP